MVLITSVEGMPGSSPELPRISVLGPTRLSVEGHEVHVGALKQRALLASLALRRGGPVSVDRLQAALWSEDPPARALNTVQGYVTEVRRLLEPQRPPRGESRFLRRTRDGYLLDLPPENVDANLVGLVVASTNQAASLVADPTRPSAAPADVPVFHEALARLDGVLRLWRGTPYDDLGDDDVAVVAERARLEELRVIASERAVILQMALRTDERCLPRLEILTAENPLRERLWLLHALCLARNGRQADALSVVRVLRHTLHRELGIEPCAEVRLLEQDILHQRPGLTSRSPEDLPEPAAITRRTWPADLVGPSAPIALKQAGASVPLPGRPAEEPPRPAVPRLPRRPGTPVLVGREKEYEALLGLLDDASRGAARCATLFGEPGSGKSRLVKELVGAAEALGFCVATGSGVEDAGASPWWPLHRILDELAAGCGVRIPDLTRQEASEADLERARFQRWEAIVAAVRAAACVRPVLLVVEDVHWADRSTLGALTHLVREMGADRTALVMTSRGGGTTLATSGLLNAFARAGGLRLELHGLDRAGVASLVQAVGSTRPDAVTAEALRRRTGGLPLYVTELARSEDYLPGRVPGAVRDLVGHRVRALPAATVRSLQAASVIGVDFAIPLLARVLDDDEEAVMSVLDAAVDDELVRARGEDGYAFAHEVVREALLAALTRADRTTWHAAVAAALEDRPDRHDTQRWARIAFHWQKAGSQHAGRAWRAALRASERAREVHALEDEADLLGQAVESQRHDPDASDRERHALLLRRAAVCRWAGRTRVADEALEEALALAEDADDPHLVCEAATAGTGGVVWHGRGYGSLNRLRIRTLQDLLVRLPAGDSADRARTLVTLALESYYVAPPTEIDGLVVTALSMAERIGDPALVLATRLTALSATWRADAADRREEEARQVLRAAEEHGDPHVLALALVLMAVLEAETGRVQQMKDLLPRAIDVASRHHVWSVLPVAELLRASWSALADEPDAAEAALARAETTVTTFRLEEMYHGLNTTRMILDMWTGAGERLATSLESLDALPHVPPGSFVPALWLRLGQPDRARAAHGLRGAEVGAPTFLGTFNTALAAEVALGLGLPDLAGAPTTGYCRTRDGRPRPGRWPTSGRSTRSWRAPLPRWATSAVPSRMPTRLSACAHSGTLPGSRRGWVACASGMVSERTPSWWRGAGRPSRERDRTAVFRRRSR